MCALILSVTFFSVTLLSPSRTQGNGETVFKHTKIFHAPQQQIYKEQSIPKKCRDLKRRDLQSSIIDIS